MKSNAKSSDADIVIRPTEGIGPVPSDIVLVSDYPGKWENVKGRPLVGKTGDEVKRYLDGKSLPHFDDIYIVNLIREWNPANEYSEADVRRDEHMLMEDLYDCDPKVIVTLGRWSTRWFLGDVNMDEVQGIPWYWPNAPVEFSGNEAAARIPEQKDRRAVRGRASKRGQSRDSVGTVQPPVVFPIYNPAAGFRSPEVQAYVNHGFKELAHFFAGKIEARELFKDPFPKPYYQQAPNDASWVWAALLGVKDIYVDSEGHPDDVWSVQFAIKGGAAYLIKFDQKKALKAFFQWMVTNKPRVTYHGSLHDFGIMRVVMQSLGIDIEGLYDVPFDDTQIMAYLLQLEPIGLKPNCVRHCNMKMQDYDEVLGDAQMKLAHDYLIKIHDKEMEAYRARQQEEFDKINATPLVDKEGKPKRDKEGNIKLRHTRVLPKLPMSDLHKAAKRVLNSQDPYKLWQEQREDIQVAAYNLEVE